MRKVIVSLDKRYSLAMRRVEFELRMKLDKLIFLMGRNRDNPDYLDSEQFEEYETQYLEKYIQYRHVELDIIRLLLNDVQDQRITCSFRNNYQLAEFMLPDELADSIESQNQKGVDERRDFESFTDFIGRAYPEFGGLDTRGKPVQERIMSRTVTFQVTDACNLACTYCYQVNKGSRRMPYELAKKFVDKLLSGEDGFYKYVNPSISPAIVIEFIGGEPLLEVGLIDKIVDYFRERTIELDHPWADMFCISICSNGVLYRDPAVQEFLQKNHNIVSFSVTLDGNRELHDSCRVFPDGSPSYDIAAAATDDWMSRGYYMGSKITISPENLSYINQALKHIVELGYKDINANCVYEAEWNNGHAAQFYWLLKDFADFLLDGDRNVYCSLFRDLLGIPKAEEDLQNWCGGTGFMLSMDPDGYLFPCIRYMESSLGADQKPMSIGHMDTGLAVCEHDKKCVDCLNAIDRRTQSTDECFYCPIAEGCSWCSAYNYQTFGTADKRVTKLCPMHKARVLANVYYYNKYYEKYGMDKAFDLWVPEEWGIPIIGNEEYDRLAALVNQRGGYINRHETVIRGFKPEEHGYAENYY